MHFRQVWFGLFLGSVLTALVNLHGEELHCDKGAWQFAPADSSAHRKYAPDRAIDILNLALDVTPNFQRRTVAGTAILTFKPIAKSLSELTLDAVDLRIEQVTASVPVRHFQTAEGVLTVTFNDPLPANTEVQLTVVYWAEPTKGLYFRTPEMGYLAGDTHLFTQGEAIEARHWYPSFDAPNEKFTSEITCRVPEGMTVLSNGRLVSQERDAATGLSVVHWRQDKPHSNYLISLVAGYFKKVEDQYRNIPLAFFTPASQINEAQASFRDTKEAMAFFEKEIGVAYPWAKYFQVCVNDFVAGGMENTSITTLTDHTLFSDKSENISSSQGLMAHELAHQWFGDLVTCKDWSHLWLNEGFATYYAHLFDGAKNGRDFMLYGLYRDAKGIVDRTDDTKSIVYRKFDDPSEQFSYLAYPKGSWVLHMLRAQLGEDLYRRCISTYLERNQYDSVVTEDLNRVIEQLSGRSFDRFFDQWVYHAHHPELEVSYSWDERSKLAKLSVRQNQKLSDDVLLFQFPLTVRFHGKSEAVDRTIWVKEKSEDFYFALPNAPKLVRVDPELTLLAKIDFNVSSGMLDEQCQEKGDVVGRLLAVEQLARRKDGRAIEKLKGLLQRDGFYGVRVEAARALREIHNEEAFAALVESLQQADARVRQEVVAAVAGFYRAEAEEIAGRVARNESNPEIVATAIRALGTYPSASVRALLLQYLQTESYRNVLADAAISGIRAQDDPSYLDPLQKALRERREAFTSSGLGRGLETLAYLARNQDKKSEVRDFLLEFVNDRRKSVQLASMRALGTLGDPTALAVLGTFASARKGSPERETAERAIAALRVAKKPGDDWRDLRNEVLDLQKQTRELKNQIEEFKRQIEASRSVLENSSPKEAPAKGR